MFYQTFSVDITMISPGPGLTYLVQLYCLCKQSKKHNRENSKDEQHESHKKLWVNSGDREG